MRPCTDRKRSWTNALYSLAAEYKRRHPQATPREAWAHFCAIAVMGAEDVLLSRDPVADVLSYRPDAERVAVRTIKRRSFERRYIELATYS